MSRWGGAARLTRGIKPGVAASERSAAAAGGAKTHRQPSQATRNPESSWPATAPDADKPPQTASARLL